MAHVIRRFRLVLLCFWLLAHFITSHDSILDSIMYSGEWKKGRAEYHHHRTFDDRPARHRSRGRLSPRSLWKSTTYRIDNFSRGQPIGCICIPRHVCPDRPDQKTDYLLWKERCGRTTRRDATRQIDRKWKKRTKKKRAGKRKRRQNLRGGTCRHVLGSIWPDNISKRGG